MHAWSLAGLGISLRETWDIHDELRAGKFCRVLPDWEANTSQISVVRARREPIPRRLSVFIDFMTENGNGHHGMMINVPKDSPNRSNRS